MIHSKRLCASVFFLLSACGSAENKRTEVPVEEPAPTEFVIGEDMNLTDAELANLKARIVHSRNLIKGSVTNAIVAARKACLDIFHRVDKIESDLAAAQSETFLLVDKRRDLQKIAALKLDERAKNQNELASRKGEIEALKSAIAYFGPRQKALLAQLNRVYADKISNLEDQLDKVRDRIAGTLETLPFNYELYLKLDAQEDDLVSQIAWTRLALARQIHLIVRSGVTTLAKLKADLAKAEAEFAQLAPKLRALIADATSDIAQLRKQIAKVTDEIQNNKVARDFVAPTIPSECRVFVVGRY
jgi:chromosome segregation ATPase